MPTRRQLIQKIQLNGNASSVTFSNIPGTYTDLMLVLSGRTDYSGGLNGGVQDVVIRVNNDSGNNYSYRVLYGQTSTAGSFSGSSVSSIHFGNLPTANSTASTFCSNKLYIPNYAGSKNKSMSLTAARENNSTFGDNRAITGLWSNTAAITRVDVIAEYPSGSLVAGSTFYLYGITHVPIINGGETTVIGGFKIHTFHSTSTLQVVEPGEVEYLVIAGGASGGGYLGGGGGAGGYRSSAQGENSGGGATSEPKLRLAAGNHTITIGAGGASVGADATVGNNGSSSSISSITSTGGGGGGSYSINDNRPGVTGGSGGGGGASQAENSARPAGSGTANQGYSGGTGNRGTSSRYVGGGGGGAGQIGGNATTGGLCGNGGNGVTSSITGSSVFRAGGGGGSGGATTTAGTGGSGGGGNGVVYSTNNGVPGAANTGGGGGGQAGSYPTYVSGNGGSGVVVIRYPYDGN